MLPAQCSSGNYTDTKEQSQKLDQTFSGFKCCSSTNQAKSTLRFSMESWNPTSMTCCPGFCCFLYLITKEILKCCSIKHSCLKVELTVIGVEQIQRPCQGREPWWLTEVVSSVVMVWWSGHLFLVTAWDLAYNCLCMQRSSNQMWQWQPQVATITAQVWSLGLRALSHTGQSEKPSSLPSPGEN